MSTATWAFLAGLGLTPLLAVLAFLVAFFIESARDARKERQR